MKKLSGHLQYHWWQYLVYTIVVIFLWCTVFQVLAQPANHEAIRILFVGEYWDTQALADEIHTHLQQTTAQPISAVEIDIEAQKTDQLLRRNPASAVIRERSRCMWPLAITRPASWAPPAARPMPC